MALALKWLHVTNYFGTIVAIYDKEGEPEGKERGEGTKRRINRKIPWRERGRKMGD